jgi:hypothetical protein
VAVDAVRGTATVNGEASFEALSAQVAAAGYQLVGLA